MKMARSGYQPKRAKPNQEEVSVSPVSETPAAGGHSNQYTLPRKGFVTAKRSTNGHHKKPKGDGASEVEDAVTLTPPATGLLLAKYDEETLRKVTEKHAGSPPRVAEESPAADYMDNMRALAGLFAHLPQDPVKLAKLMKAADVEPPPDFDRWLREIAKGFWREADEDQQADDWLWNKYPERPDEEVEPGKVPQSKLVTRRLSEVHERPVEWLWPQRIPIGYLSLVNGDPGLGKTWVILDTLARITTGRGFPDGSANPYAAEASKGSGCARRDVLWVSAEDADEDTVKPRFRLLGGDQSRFHSLRFVDDRTGNNPAERTLDLSKHLELLDRWLFDHKLVAAVAIDPLAAFLGKVDSHRNSDVRGLLTPLTKLAEKHRVAIIGNNHLTKGDGVNALYRGMGSIAFVAAARSSWLVTPDPQQPADRRLFTRVKANLAAEDVGGLAFRVGPTVEGAFFWEEVRVDTTADDALVVLRPEGDTRAPAKREAKEWLTELLANGPVHAAEAWELAEADRMCERTVKTAKAEMGVKSKRVGGRDGKVYWMLPGQTLPKQ